MNDEQISLVSSLEAILFYLAEPVKIDFLCKTLDKTREEIDSALGVLSESLKSRGLRLVFHEDEIVLTTAPEYSDVIEKIIKEERERDLGRSGIETLSIIAYKGPVSKKEIEYIRGVNSQYALRNLLLRGLIERKSSEIDSRSVGYNITGDALRFLGLTNISELPEYADVNKQLDVLEEQEQNDQELAG